MIVSERRYALIHELRDDPEPSLDECIERMAPCDLVLIEGYKRHPVPHLETHRAANGKPLLYPTDEKIVAVASDVALDTRLPRFALDDADGVAHFILNHLELT